eukprot:gene29848-36038_t
MSLSTAGANGFKAFSRSTPQLYRDCLRLVKHIAGRSQKGENIRRVLRHEFRKNATLEDPAKVEQLKSNAVRGLANYLMIESASKDARLGKQANIFAEKEIKEANEALNPNTSHTNK